MVDVEAKFESDSDNENLALQAPNSKHHRMPTGLKASQRLVSPTKYTTWRRAMLVLFRANGVLHIMRDAIVLEQSHSLSEDFHGAPAEAAYKAARVAGTPISGAATLASADLDPWDPSEDMTLLLRADALIDASIGKDAAARVAGVENVRLKWRILAQWGRDREQSSYFKFHDELMSLRSADFATAEEFVNEFMELRAAMINSNPRSAINEQFEFALDRAAGKFRPALMICDNDSRKGWEPLLRLTAMTEDIVRAEGVMKHSTHRIDGGRISSVQRR